MSQHAFELCLLLVNDIYGELSSIVFSTLLKYGRLHLAGLVHHSSLSPSQIKHGLAVLIQQHLVLHYTSPDRGLTYYEADWKNAYLLVRSGKIIKLIETRIGQSAGAVVSNLLLLGSARVGDLAEAYGVTSGKSSEIDTVGEHHVNGDHLSNGVSATRDESRHQINTLEQLHTVLESLIYSGFVSEVREQHFRPSTDNANEAEQIVRVKLDAVTGKTSVKKKAEIDIAIQKQLMKWRDGEIKMSGDYNPIKGYKRLSNESTPGSTKKRSKFDHVFTNGVNSRLGRDDISSTALDENMVVRINYEKCTVAFRSERLIELAERRIGETTSQVYAGLLHQLEARIPRCHDDLKVFEDAEEELAEAPSISTLKVAISLSEDIDLASSIGEVSDFIRKTVSQSLRKGRSDHDTAGGGDDASADDDQDENAGTSTKVRLREQMDHHEGSDGDSADHFWNESGEPDTKRRKDDDPDPDADSLPTSKQERLGLIKDHLQILAEDPAQLLTSSGNRGFGEWKVDFPALVKYLRYAELVDTINARFGEKAKRVVGLLLDKGKFDEKALAQVAMVKQSEIRAILTEMQAAGHMELQEVPKDTNRQPSRTMFLWYFDPERCRQLVLEETYKAMARALQRARQEKRGIQEVIDKAERTDVVGKEDEYLSPSERNALQIWRDKEERLLVQVARLDDIVCLLRDF